MFGRLRSLRSQYSTYWLYLLSHEVVGGVFDKELRLGSIRFRLDIVLYSIPISERGASYALTHLWARWT